MNKIGDEGRKREIRVFISSTFNDMQAEREVLIKQIFPQLRKLCEERGIVWGEVDLRWGITEEQARKGMVLPICLEEIQRCRPYFIGLLGERYGWMPDDYPAESLELHPWLKEHPGHSITELEILHGVLNDPEMAEHAFFYFRDPAYLDNLPSEIKRSFSNRPTAGEIEKLSREQAEALFQLRERKLAGLKDRIRESSFPVRENYPDPAALGELVLRDLTGLVENLFPEGEQLEPLDQEAVMHETYAAGLSDIYIGRQKDFDRLDAHAAGSGDPLVVLGASGLGKSALLANWAAEFQKENKDVLTVMHFIGGSPNSSDWQLMLRRVLGELKRTFDLPGEIPDQADALRSTFASWLYLAAAKGRFMLIFDAVNQLEDREGALELVWMPPAVPENARLIFSTRPGRSQDALVRRGWPAMEIEPLDLAERKLLITRYLQKYSKALTTEQVERISSQSQAQNPLYLRTLLEELRLFGIHELLDQRIGHYLDAPDIDTLYGKVLTRYEDDYEADRPSLVEDAMTLLWAARRGLSRAEILELLGEHGEPMSHAHWSPLFLAAEGSLTDHAGLIGFRHESFRRAIESNYLFDAEKQRCAHERLADYFAGRDLGRRKVEELPWQLEKAEAWQRLYDLLSELAFIDFAWEISTSEVKRSWAQLESHSDFRMTDAYQAVMHQVRFGSDRSSIRQGEAAPARGSLLRRISREPDRLEEIGEPADHSTIRNITILLSESGYIREAMGLAEHQVSQFRQQDDRPELLKALDAQATMHYLQDEFDRALAVGKDMESLCRELGDDNRLCTCLNNQAEVLRRMGRLQQAMAIHQQVEQLARKLDLQHTLEASLGNQAIIHYQWGDLQKAMALHKQEERICRELGNMSSLSMSLFNQALILRDQGDLHGAMALHKEEEKMCRNLGERLGIANSLMTQAGILMQQGNFTQALERYKGLETVYREIGNIQWILRSLGDQARVLAAMGRPSEMKEMIGKAIDLASQHGIREAVQDFRRLEYELTFSPRRGGNQP